MDIEETIGQVEKLYRAVTGHGAPASDAAYAPIPPEKDPVEHVEQQMDRLLSALAAPMGIGATTPARVASPQTGAAPSVSIWESSDDILVCFDLPGTTRDRVDVRIEGNVLVVSGDRHRAPDEAHRLVMSEHAMGSFRRGLVLPPGTKPQEMSAQLKDGVLEVRVPRDAKSPFTPRTIPVS